MRILMLGLVLAVPGVAFAQEAEDEPATDPGTHDAQLANAEHQVRELSSDIRQTEIRLWNLMNNRLGMPVGAEATIRVENRMGPMYRLIEARLGLDGTAIMTTRDEDGLPDVIPAFTGSIPPGDHVLSVRLVYVGETSSPFPYVGGYRMVTSSSHDFSIGHHAYRLTVLGHPADGPTSAFLTRPRVGFVEHDAP